MTARAAPACVISSRYVAQETVLFPLLEGDKYNQSFLAASDRLGAVLGVKIEDDAGVNPTESRDARVSHNPVLVP